MIDTVARFKGLEAPATVLWAFDGLSREQHLELLYVGTSRAKSLLCVAGDSASCYDLLLPRSLAVACTIRNSICLHVQHTSVFKSSGRVNGKLLNRVNVNQQAQWTMSASAHAVLAPVERLRREPDRIERVEVGIDVVALFAGFTNCMGKIVGIVEVADEEPFCTDP